MFLLAVIAVGMLLLGFFIMIAVQECAKTLGELLKEVRHFKMHSFSIYSDYIVGASHQDTEELLRQLRHIYQRMAYWMKKDTDSEESDAGANP